MHAYAPDCMEVLEGRRVRIAECRPLTKTVAFVVIEVEQ
jgi:small subunit ribosomal protein S17